MKKLPLIEKMLKEIFDELEKDAYDVDFHGYHYKQANQIIRKYFEILIKPVELPSDEELEKWKQIEHDFIVWDKKGNFNASQRQILNWFKVRFNSLNLINKLPTNEEIHFAGMNHYDYRIVDDGKTKEKIIRFANIWREGAKWMRDKLINK